MRGIEDLRMRGFEDARNRGFEDLRNRGIEDLRMRDYYHLLAQFPLPTSFSFPRILDSSNTQFLLFRLRLASLEYSNTRFLEYSFSDFADCQFSKKQPIRVVGQGWPNRLLFYGG